MGHNNPHMKLGRFIILILLILAVEAALQGFAPFSSPYFPILFKAQPFGVTLHLLWAQARAALGYFVLFGTLILVFLPNRKRNTIKLAIALGLLWLSRLETQSGSLSKTKTDNSKPSFLLLSFDAVPADFFNYEERSSIAMPLWKQHWRETAIGFQNAYSVTNSTFTSWFSVLSGAPPLESGVVSLYPNPREGNTKLTDLLPAQLSRLGYRTLYMTDCATTAPMKEEYGFQELHQTDRGGLLSAHSLIQSTHPLLGLFSKTPLFPELQTYGSRFYDPSYFGRKVRDKIASLQKDHGPFFLAVHSCVTHHDVRKHKPDADSKLLKEVPLTKISEINDMYYSLRLADEMADTILHQFKQGSRNHWAFLFSDHGVKLEKKTDETYFPLSHALGPPINRFQYHVPLYVLTPHLSETKNFSHFVSLLDIFPTVLRLAGAPSSQTEGKDLWNPEKRIVFLTSAVPDGDPLNPNRFYSLLKEGEFTPNGDYYFPKNYRPENYSLAVLDWPYRLVKTPDSVALYHEVKDPENHTNLFLQKRDLGERLQRMACQTSPSICKKTDLWVASHPPLH